MGLIHQCFHGRGEVASAYTHWRNPGSWGSVIAPMGLWGVNVLLSMKICSRTPWTKASQPYILLFSCLWATMSCLVLLKRWHCHCRHLWLVHTFGQSTGQGCCRGCTPEWQAVSVAFDRLPCTVGHRENVFIPGVPYFVQFCRADIGIIVWYANDTLADNCFLCEWTSAETYAA